ncbi:MAG: hypothetical protein EOP50_10490 [Sphingobacteriales bacterium]|nr:MAG: hypothetical protein EOP50_10490 [Sphingobacteriales bacterium]
MVRGDYIIFSDSHFTEARFAPRELGDLMIFYAVTAVVFCSIGFVAGGFFSASKIAYLYHALEQAEYAQGKDARHFEESARLLKE